MVNFNTIIIPVALQSDTLAAIFLLKKFGRGKYPGIENASIEIWQTMPENETTTSLEKKGYILIDIGDGIFDHHEEKDKTHAAQLVVDHLNIADDPAIAMILEYTRRCDMFGKGIVSDDPIDRAFGLPGLIQNLNRANIGKPNNVANIVLPIFDAHYQEMVRRTKEVPEEFERQKNSGNVSFLETRQQKKKLSVVFITSDNGGLAGYLRSGNGGRYDVVVQRSLKGYVNIMTRSVKRIDLHALAALIRMHEAEAQQINIPHDPRALTQTARHPKIKEWYYDRATNTIQNGGLNPKDIPPTQIPWEEFPHIIERGLTQQIFNIIP
jgi:hypothetical protein